MACGELFKILNKFNKKVVLFIKGQVASIYVTVTKC